MADIMRSDEEFKAAVQQRRAAWVRRRHQIRRTLAASCGGVMLVLAVLAAAPRLLSMQNKQAAPENPAYNSSLNSSAAPGSSTAAPSEEQTKTSAKEEKKQGVTLAQALEDVGRMVPSVTVTCGQQVRIYVGAAAFCRVQEFLETVMTGDVLSGDEAGCRIEMVDVGKENETQRTVYWVPADRMEELEACLAVLKPLEQIK